MARKARRLGPCADVHRSAADSPIRLLGFKGNEVFICSA